ncbi:MAG: hypothetical protein AAF390_13255 [Pseudomonadota bacterium]
MRSLVSLLTAMAVIVGLLAPRMAAVAAEFAPGTLRVVVICTGAEMQTIVMDASGEAVDIAESGPCVVTDLPVAGGPLSFWQRLQLAWHPDLAAAHLAPRPAPLDRRPPGRAPPALV